MGVAVGDFDNDGFPDLYITAVGQSRLFRNNRRGRFVDVTNAAGLGGRSALSTSAMWLDYDRDGLLDLFVCNYVRWSQKDDVRCTLDGVNKSYCTPEAYRGETCWLFRNKGDGTFEDVTARSGIFDPSSKSLGVAMLDVDQDGWPDLFVANDTQPNKLYLNNRNGTFSESAVRMGIAFNEDGRARAGMGVDSGDFLRTGRMGVAVTNFDNEMLGLWELTNRGFVDRAATTGVGRASRDRLGFGCMFGDFDLDGAGRISRDGPKRARLFVWTGIQLLAKRVVSDPPSDVFSTNVFWDRAIAAGRCYGLVHDGLWFDVGYPAAIDMTEAALEGGCPSP